MDKEKCCALIKHYFLRNKSSKETKEKLDKYYGEFAPSCSTAKYWIAEFKRRQISTNDGAPKTATTTEYIEKIHNFVLDDPKVKALEIAAAVGISTGSVLSILHEHFCMRKLTAIWVSRLFTIDQKHERVCTSQQCLDMFKQNPLNFLR